MPGLLDQGFLTDPNTQLAAGLLGGTSPFFGTNLGNAIQQTGALQMQQHKDMRADRQAELAQLVQTYSILKQQDQQAQAMAQYDNVPYTPNPLLKLHEQKLAQLMGGSMPPDQTQGAAQGTPAALPQGGLLSGMQPAPMPSPPPQGVPAVGMPSPQPQGPPPVGMPSVPPQGMPEVSPQQQATLRQSARAANIPDSAARVLISQGKIGDLIKQINEALAPKNGPAGLSRINPITGQMEIVGGNASPGTVPFTRDASGKLVAQPIQGAKEEVASAEALKQDAINASNARTDLIDVPMGNGQTVKMSRADYLAQRGQPAAPQAPQPGYPTTVTPDVQKSRDGESVRILQTELLKEMQQPPSAGRDQNIAALRTELRARGATTPNAPASSAPAPSGQLGLSQSPGAKVEQEGLAKQGVDYKVALDSNVQEGNNFMSEIGQAKKMLDQFQPGMGAGVRLQLARFAHDVLGADDDLTSRINAGDVGAKQAFEKMAAKQAMDSLKQSLSGGSRMSQMEFKVFLANNPNIEMTPGAINKVYQFAQDQHLKHVAEQAAMATYVDQGGRLSDWPRVWTQMQLKQGALTPMGAPGVTTMKFDKMGNPI